MPRNWNPEDLFVVVPLCTSIDQVVVALGLKLAGGNRETVKRWISDFEIDTSHFLGQGHRKGSKVAVIEKRDLDEILVKNSSYTNTHRLKLRLISENIFKHQCMKCELEVWQGFKIPLELHHVNGVRNDHRLSNLELLCPNCHALTDNYRAKNMALMVK